MNRVLASIFLTFLVYCVSGQAVWSTNLENLGTFSSPRCVDLNGDDVLDIVIGAGREEFKSCDSAIIAINGIDGSILWHAFARDQVFGSATFHDVNQDGTPDIIINGRSAEFQAVNGKNGQLIWEFYDKGKSEKPSKFGWYNFYNPQIIPDQDKDNIDDFLVSNGGDVTVPPHDPNRPPGNLLIISAATGKLLYKAEMPDGLETYMSVVVDDIDKDGELDVIYGTGGETLTGNLFRTTLSDIKKGDLTRSYNLARGVNKGFIAPPVLADITGDGKKDIIANAVDGRILAFDGSNNRPLWSHGIPGTEAYTGLAVGDFNGDKIPDFFGNYAIGTWPDLSSTKPFLMDGRGKVVFVDSVGFYQISSPVITDFTGDGRLDVMISSNFIVNDGSDKGTIHNSLLVYDFSKHGKFSLTTPKVGSNVASTPWIGDLDGNGYLDIIYTNMTYPDQAYTYTGFRINRWEIKSHKMTGPVTWGAYMGNHYNGIFK